MPNIDFVEVKWNVGNTDGLAMRLLWALTRPAETSLEGEENTLDNLHFSTGRERAVNVNAASSSASCSVKCFLNFLHLDDKCSDLPEEVSTCNLLPTPSITCKYSLPGSPEY
jgi:hypothetical protein